MILGFNHNVMYKGEVFHVQTEDSGLNNPHIITLLFKGGVILASRKTSYADILKMEQLEAVVTELMKEQHKEMMRRLTAGEFDECVLSAQPVSRSGDADPDAPVPSRHFSPSEHDPSLPHDTASPAVVASESSPASRSQDIPTSAVSLDEAVRAFFDPHEN